MTIFGRRPITFHSRLTVNQCTGDLLAAMEKDPWYIFPALYSSRPVMGTLTKNGFRIRKPRRNLPQFAPFFYGTLREDATGTLIEGHFGMNPVTKVFTIFWFVMFYGSAYFSFGLPALFFLLVPGGGMILLSQLLVYSDRKYLLEFLERTFKARRVSANTIEL